MVLLHLALACTCGGEEICSVSSGRYNAFEPEGWDGTSELPVVVEIHGWNGAPEGLYSKDELLEGWSEAGVLWVLPEGRNRNWNVAGPDAGRDEPAFIADVIADVADRWPVDARRHYIVGFSVGAGVAYGAACADTSAWAGVYGLSGGFFQPLPTACLGPPLPVLHVHGTSDETWPIEGRTLGLSLAQGGMEENLDLWRDHASCDLPVPTEHQAWECSIESCAEDASIRACLHDGGHKRPDTYIAEASAWLFSHAR